MDQRDKLLEIVEDAKTVMLVTKSVDGSLSARPMVLAGRDDAGVFWFVSRADSKKVKDIEADPCVEITVQNEGRYAALRGRGFTTQSREKIAELWKDTYQVWFPRGKDDPNVELIGVDAEEGEYWDSAGMESASYILKAAAAYASGRTPESSVEEHGRMRF